MRMPWIAVPLALVLGAGAASAQEADTVVSSHRIAAEELVELLRLERASAQASEMVSQGMPAAGPMAGQFQEMMREFQEEAMRWEDLEPGYVDIYVEAFTEPEIRELIAFYQSPIGQRLLDQQPLIAQRSMTLAQEAMRPLLEELQRRIRALATGVR